ncbi:hypothetical protein ACFVHW_07200 [Streptomyces sp. NPDC127110]|uniref:hypothetical protein n=1 Tax=Streptomyces sp. NPDC127110 TaxID=3345362 RepID=UPI003639B2CB
MLAALWRHLQWRGLTLAGLGILWITYGIGLIATDRPALVSAAAPLLRVMCLEAWGGVWIACGALGVVTAALRPGRDLAGFAGAAGPPLVWGLAYIAAAVTGSYGVAWASVPLFAAILLLVVIVAALTGGRTRGCACEGVADGR